MTHALESFILTVALIMQMGATSAIRADPAGDGSAELAEGKTSAGTPGARDAVSFRQEFTTRRAASPVADDTWTGRQSEATRPLRNRQGTLKIAESKNRQWLTLQRIGHAGGQPEYDSSGGDLMENDFLWTHFVLDDER